MREALLIDTSVWIDFFRGSDTPQVKTLTVYIQNDDPVFICPVILQEILQGIRSEKQFKEIREYLLCLNILKDDAIETAIGAARIYRTLRKMGITIRKSNDSIIAHYAIKYSMEILHRDRDFDVMLENF